MPPQPTHAARSDGATPTPVRPRSTNRLGEWGANLAAPTLAGLAALVVWWAIVRIFEIPDYLLPAPQAVAARIVKEWPVLVKHGSYTLLSVLTGFVSAVVIGVPLAFGIVLSRSMERVAMPFLVMSQTIPKVAIAPILVVWLGFGILPKIAIVFLISFFPIVVSTVVGLKSVETDMIDLVRSMGARTLKIMLRVRGPSALPQMFAGFKIAVCLAVVGAIVGEFVGSDRGLGYLLLTSTGTLDGTLGLVGAVRPDRDGHDVVRHRVEARTPGDPLARFGARRRCGGLSILNRRREMNVVRLCRAVVAAAILGGFVAESRRRRRCGQLPAGLDAVGLSPAVLLGEGEGLLRRGESRRRHQGGRRLRQDRRIDVGPAGRHRARRLHVHVGRRRQGHEAQGHLRRGPGRRLGDHLARRLADQEAGRT